LRKEIIIVLFDLTSRTQFSKHRVIFVLHEEKSKGMLLALKVRIDERIDFIDYTDHLRSIF
jgi:hypothetical protein